MSTGQFEWPCDRRDAHHVHTIKTKVKVTKNAFTWQEKHCPGVAAHPSTQIGGNYMSERPDES